jgi:amidohydrolase
MGGTVLVIGTPGEELYGGKVRMVEKGAFNDVDAAMMVHPAGENVAHLWTIACQTLDVEFFGKPAHAAARPEEGINALEAMILAFNGINSLRQHIRDKARIHGIITRGGDAANIVPEHTAGNFIARAEENDYLEELKKKVLDCFTGAATATGARLEYRWAEVCYQAMRSNMAMAQLFKNNMESLGRTMCFTNSSGTFSTDMGNVSNVVPGIHPLIAIAPPEVLARPRLRQRQGRDGGLRGIRGKRRHTG